MKRLLAVLIMMSIVSLVSLASAGTEDENYEEATPVYFGFTFKICEEKKPCESEKDSVADGESDEEPNQEDNKK